MERAPAVDVHGHEIAELRVLLVEDDDDFAALVGAQLSRPERSTEMDLVHVTDMAAALESLAGERFDVVLLDLGLPDEKGLRSVKRVVDEAGDAAIVVVTAHEEPLMALQAVAVGAQEYVLKREVTAPLLERSIRYAVERRRLDLELQEARKRERAERELRRLERLSDTDRTSVTAELFGQGPIWKRSPGRWGELEAEYARVLERALEERTHQTTPQATDDLRSLAGVIGFLGGTPRDVVLLHSRVLHHTVRDVNPTGVEARVDEARVLVLELMGHLANYYRTRAAAPLAARPNEEG